MNAMLLDASRWLADFFLLATVLLAGVLIAGALIRQSARRIAVAWSAAVALLGLGVLCAIPGWSLVHMTRPLLEPPAWTAELQPLVGPAVQVYEPSPTMASEQVSTKAPVAGTTVAASRIVVIDYGVVLALVVFGGAMVIAAWLVLGGWQVHRLRARSVPPSTGLADLFAKLAPAERAGPKLGIVENLPVAAAVGLRRPMVLLPQSMVDSTSPAKLHSVLAHEVAHVRNRDLWLLALLRILLLVLWPHPFYLLWRRRVRLDQETLADVAAADVTNRTDYAEQLVAWARVASAAGTSRLASSIGLWESPSQLKQRVAMLLDEKLTVLRRCSRRWRVSSAISLTVIAVGLSLVTLTPADTLVAEVKSEENKEAETATDPTDLSDEERLKLMRPLNKRLHDAIKPNMIQGICIDENGRPLANVPVQVIVQRIDRSDVPKPILTAITDGQGEFSFVDVVDVEREFPDGIPEEHFQPRDAKIFTIIGRADGRVPGYQTDLSMKIARHGGSMVWVMQPAEILRGQIVDQQRNPVAGAQISTGYTGWWGGDHGINSATTNANGNYVIDDLTAFDAVAERRKAAAAMKANPESALTRSSYGDLRESLLVKHPNFAAKRANVDHIPGKVDVQLVLGSVIEGRVRLPTGEVSGKSIAGSVVRLQRVLPQPKPGTRPDAHSYQIETTTADETGHYRFESLPAGKYHLTADVKGWVTRGTENVEVAIGQTTTAPDILLMHGGRVRVQLLDDKAGEPMRFEQPTKGYINPSSRPQRAGVFSFRNNMVEFSTDGIGEIQILAGQYWIFVSIPTVEGGSMTSVVTDDRFEWPTYQVVDGELLEISTRLRVQKPSEAATSRVLVATPASDESSEDETPKVSFILATPAAEESEAEDK